MSANVTPITERPKQARKRHRNAKRNPGRAFEDADGNEVEPVEFVRKAWREPKLQRFVKHGSERSVFDAEFKDGSRVCVGNGTQIQECKHVRGALAESGHYIGRFKADEWDEVFRAIIAGAEVEDTVASESEETRGWLVSFSEDRLDGPRRSKVSEEDRLAALLRERADAFVGEDRRLHVRLEPFMRHVNVALGQRTTGRDLSTRLGRLGFEKRQLSLRHGDEVLKGRYWVSPAAFDPEESS